MPRPPGCLDPGSTLSRGGARGHRAANQEGRGRGPGGPRPRRGRAGVVLWSAAAAAGRADAVAGLLEDALDDAAEGEHDDEDQGRDAGDEQAVLDRDAPRSSILARRAFSMMRR